MGTSTPTGAPDRWLRAGSLVAGIGLSVAGLGLLTLIGRRRRSGHLPELPESAFERAPDGVLVVAQDGRIRGANASVLRMSGYAREELLGRPIFDLVASECMADLREELARTLRGAGRVSSWELRRRDGSFMPVEVSAATLPDGRALGILRDVTRRRELEASLRDSHADLARAQAVAHIGSWRLDVRHDELRWSDEAYRIFGVPQGVQLTYATFLDRVHPDDRARVDACWRAALGGAPYDIEHRVAVDGEVRWVREKAELEFDARGRLLGGVGITQDITERRRLEQEVEAAEARSSGILAVSADAIVSIDERQRVTLFNRGAEQIFGYADHEVLGQPFERLVPPRYRAVYRERLERFAEGSIQATRLRSRGEGSLAPSGGRGVRGRGTMARDEALVGLRKDGEEFAADASISKLDLPSGRILTLAIRDVTEQRRAEERLELALRGADLAAWDWNLPTGEVVFNKRWATMRGHRTDEIRPHVSAWSSRVHPDDLPRVQAVLQRHLEGHTPDYEADYRSRHRSGGWIWVLAKGEVVARDEQGRPIRMIGTELDITERKRNEEHQRLLAEVGSVFASSLDYDETLANVAHLVVRELADLCVLYLTREDGAERLLVVSRDPSHHWICDLLERVPLEGTPPDLPLEDLEAGRSVLVEHVSPQILAWFAQSDEHRRALRELRPCSFLMVPLLAHGRNLGAMVLVSAEPSGPYRSADVPHTEDLALRAALAIENARLFQTASRAVRLRDDVLGVVAHDLRNPLTAIAAQATLTQRRADADPLARDAAAAIARSAKRMSRMISDLLDVTRIEAGKLSIDARELDAAEVVRDVVEAQLPTASSRSLDLQIDLAPDLPSVLADRDRLYQVFENLVGNAIKFSSRGGTVTVGARPGEDAVEFTISDTGEGIREEDLPRLFDRFWQAHRGSHEGAGLGLPIVHGIVEAHGGQIQVASSPGCGSTFTFTIPVAHPGQRSLEPA